MSAASQLPHLMTVAAFLEWNAPDGSVRWELIDGTPQAMAPSRARHGMIAAETGRLLGNHLADHPSCRVVSEAGVKPDDYNLRIPDLSVTCETIGPDDLLLREPLLIVEILSPSNARDTWAAVVRYTTIPSVLEILVLHTASARAELLSRHAAGNWPMSTVVLEAGESVELRSIGLVVPLAAFYRTAG